MVSGSLIAQTTQRIYLSGKGIDSTVKWDFKVSKGMNSGIWSKIDVPSNWEPRGFGIYAYGREKNKPDEIGIYKQQFFVPKTAKGQELRIVFEGVMTEAEVFVNGKLAGEKHVGSYYRFYYDISKLLRYGKENELEVVVKKLPENQSVRSAEKEADFWTFGGIYRPVYLEILPHDHIERLALNAKQNGSLEVDYFVSCSNDFEIRQSVFDLKTGKQFGSEKSFLFGGGEAEIKTNRSFSNPKLWTCETPNLYVLKSELIIKGKVIHETSERFGFRTVETRPNDGIYVNGVKVMFKGVNYHSFHPEWGRATSKALSIADIKLMKEMNMNAVRMGHYPHDQHFYDMCDSLGMFVFDEFGAYQASYDFELGKKLLTEMMVENVNHPSIVAFANGNEGGYDVSLQEVFHILDPQNRFVYHPTHYHNGFDSQHYKSYDYGVNTFAYSRDIFVQTEFLHALYDGGGGAGLSDFWEKLRKTQNSGGGFIWAYLDEGVVRRDLNDSIDCAGDLAPDGIVGPYREKEGSFYTIRDVWSPIQISMKYIPRFFNGKFKVENRYLYSSLENCFYKWRLETLPLPTQKSKVISRGEGEFGAIAAGLSGYIQLDLSEIETADVLVLEAYGINGEIVNTWNWPIATPEEICAGIFENSTGKENIEYRKEGDILKVRAGALSLHFNLINGRLIQVENSAGKIPFNNGPEFTNEVEINDVKVQETDSGLEVKTLLKEDRSWFSWNITASGLVKFSYRLFNVRGDFDLQGVSWDFPESEDVKLRYLGRGPYRVWNNRKRGLQLGLYEKKYNNTKTGTTWEYPEFKGYYADFYWAEISNSQCSFKIYNETDFAFLRVFTPEMDEARNCKVPAFPAGNISVMNAIPGIGSKINEPRVLGPDGFSHHLNLHGEQKPLQADIWFDFR